MLVVVWAVPAAEESKVDVSKESIVVVFVVDHNHVMSPPHVDSHDCHRDGCYWVAVRPKTYYPCVLSILNRSGALTLHTMYTVALSQKNETHD
jgi:hypothetical protein